MILKQKIFSYFYDKKISFVIFVSVTFFLLLFSRRWQQILSPQVWNEDGTYNIYQFMLEGWSSFFNPVQGYLITVPKIISLTSLSLSVTQYPLISTILTFVFIVFIGLAITFSPTRLQGKFLCALAVFLVPSNPEVFGLPLYTFWWAAILLFLLALWDENKSALGLRLCYLFLGGLSSPVIILVLPILYFRIFLFRKSKSEYVIGIVATLIALIQMFFMAQWNSDGTPFYLLPWAFILAIPIFFGNYLIGHWLDYTLMLWVPGLGLIASMCIFIVEKQDKLKMGILFFLLMGSIAMIASRVDLIIIAERAGPRYFFYTFILISWILIQYFYGTAKKWGHYFFITIAIITVINAIPVWSRQHDDLFWKEHVLTCRFFSEYSIPIHFDGRAAASWFIHASGNLCLDLLENDLFLSSQEIDSSLPTFAFKLTPALSTPDPKIELINSTMRGSDNQKTEIPGYQVIGSYETSDADTGEVVLKLKRGDSFLYRSGPGLGGQSISIIGYEQKYITQTPMALDWIRLQFSNSSLPDEFFVVIKDEGTAWGEWSAIAIKN